MNREPRSRDIVRVTRAASPEVVRDLARGRLTLVSIDGEDTRTIPCPAHASIMLLGVARARAKKRSKAPSTKAPETQNAPQERSYGAQGLDLSTVF